MQRNILQILATALYEPSSEDHHPLSLDQKELIKEDIAHIIEKRPDFYPVLLAELSQHYTRMKELSERDGLTGLYNRRKFENDLTAATSRVQRQGGSLSLIYADIDYFKKVNDTLGHPEGDKVLQTTAATLSSNLRDYDQSVIYRIGGEEFSVILPGLTRDEAKDVAERLRSKAENDLPTTMSFGIAPYPFDLQHYNSLLPGEASPQLQSHADTALYLAKQNGRNRVEIFGNPIRDPRMNQVIQLYAAQS